MASSLHHQAFAVMVWMLLRSGDWYYHNLHMQNLSYSIPVIPNRHHRTEMQKLSIGKLTNPLSSLSVPPSSLSVRLCIQHRKKRGFQGGGCRHTAKPLFSSRAI